MRKVIDDTQAIASVWDSLVFRTFRTCVYVHVCCNLFRRERFAATRPWFLSVLLRLAISLASGVPNSQASHQISWLACRLI